MKPMTHLILWSTIFCLIIIGFVLYLGIFSRDLFLGVVYEFVYFGGGFAFVHYILSKDTKEKESAKTLDYCWRRCNEILARMSGGYTNLKWAEGQNRISQVRTYQVGNESVKYRAWIAMTSSNNRPVVVIFNTVTEDIDRFDSMPSPQVLADPFYEFKPAERQQTMFNPMNRNGRINKRYNLNFGNDGYSGFNSYEPHDDMINRAQEVLRK